MSSTNEHHPYVSAFRPQELPNEPDYFEYWSNPARLAYQKCRSAESSSADKFSVICVRVVGFSLIHIDPLKRDIYARVVSTTSGEEELIDLGKCFVDHLIRLYKHNSRPISCPSSHPSCQSFDDQTTVTAQGSYSHGTAKELALIRDGGRCVLDRRIFDETFTENHESIHDEFKTSTSNRLGVTQCAHIISGTMIMNDNIGDDIEDPSDNRNRSASIHTTLSLFGSYLLEELDGLKIHNLRNVLTLSSGNHEAFNRLELWLEPVPDMEHEYRIVYSKVIRENTFPSLRIKLETPNHDLYPLPDPRYLKTHAACCRIANMSGAAEYVKSILRDMEETTILAHNGADGRLLHHLLGSVAREVH